MGGAISTVWRHSGRMGLVTDLKVDNEIGDMDNFVCVV